MKKLFLASLSLFFAGSVLADLTIVQKVKANTAVGQPPTEGVMTIYIKGSKAKVEMPGSVSQVTDMSTGKIFLIDATQKTVMTMTAADMAKAAEMMNPSGVQGASNVQKLGTTRTVNGYPCDDYKITTSGMITSETISCISGQIDTSEMEGFRKFSENLSKQFGALPPEVKGYPVVSDTKMTVMGQNATSHVELVSVSKDPISDSVFVIPAGYTMTEMPAMQ